MGNLQKNELHGITSEQEFFEKEIVWFSVEEAARFLKMSVNAIRVAVHRRQIPGYKFRGRLIFKKWELDRLLLTSQRVGR